MAKAVALRELGYTHAEIAGKLSFKAHQVQYALSEVNEEASPTIHDYPNLKVFENLKAV